MLLILAGISIATLSGDNGVLTKASDAKIINEMGTLKDEIVLKASEAMSDYYEKTYVSNTGELAYSKENLVKIIMKKIAKEYVENEAGGTKEYGTYTVTISGTEEGATITIQSKTKSSIKTVGTMKDDGIIIWDDNFKSKTSDNPPEEYEELEINNDNVEWLGFTKNSSKDLIIPEKLNHEGKKYTVTSISSKTLYGDTQLEKVSIPSTVEKIGRGAFDKIKSLKEIKIDENNAYFKDVDGVVFTKSGKTLIKYPDNKQGENYSVPNEVEVIGEEAFESNNTLKKISLNNVESIKINAFSSSNIEEIEFGNKIKKIEPASFYSCKKLETVEIPGTVERIGNFSFFRSPKLKNVILSEGIREIGYSAFADCVLSSITIPKSVEKIENYAFSFCVIIFSKYQNIKSVGQYAFACCETNDNAAKSYILSLESTAFDESFPGFFNRYSGCIYKEQSL